MPVFKNPFFIEMCGQVVIFFIFCAVTKYSYIFVDSLHEMYLANQLDTIGTFLSAMKMQ